MSKQLKFSARGRIGGHENEIRRSSFISFCSSLKKKLSRQSIFQPDVAILLELYDAEKNSEALNVTSIGLRFDVPQSTVLRRLHELEEAGWIVRSEHKTDKRVSVARLSPGVFKEIDEVFDASRFT